jgi:hypothetical protein
MSLAILFYFLCTERVSDINISIIRSLRLCSWITTLVVLFLFRCVLEIWCGWVGVVSVLQAEVCFSLQQPVTGTLYVPLYTGCNRRNGPDFGRVFLMLNYTEKPQNTYIQSWTVWEIMASDFETLTAVTHLLITKFVLKLAGICGFCNVNSCK